VSDDRYRCSFDSVAEAYERSRPGYAPDALAWLRERLPLRRVLDLAAGTGKLTAQLVEFGADVVAVEPGEKMRAVLGRVLPGVEALAGSAEAIPLADASVDAVTVGQAFHWFRPDEALAEMHRVLRPGGGLALLRNEWDDEDPLLRRLDELVELLRPAVFGERPDWREALRSSSLFGNPELRTFRHAERLPAEVVLDRLASMSPLAAAPPAERERTLDEARPLIGDREVRFPMITSVGVADRV
jgi:SAM-dependent methyltransferase